MPIGAIIGAGLSIYDAIQKKNDKDRLRRIREKEVDEAAAQNRSNRDRLQNQSPEANRRAKAMVLQQGRAGAMAQAGNIAGGNVSNSGLGSTFGSGNIAAAKAGAPLMATAAPYDNALAGTYSQKAGEEATLNQQLGQNTMDRAKIGEMTAYMYEDEEMSEIQSLLLAMRGGAQAGSQMQDLFTDTSSLEDKVKGVAGDPGEAPYSIAKPRDKTYDNLQRMLRKMASRKNGLTDFQNMLYGGNNMNELYKNQYFGGSY